MEEQRYRYYISFTYKYPSEFGIGHADWNSTKEICSQNDFPPIVEMIEENHFQGAEIAIMAFSKYADE